MRQLLFACIIVLWCSSTVKAQQFISISPDFGQSGQTISTVVTASQFFFTWGSAPGPWGDFYMRQGNQFIYPSAVNVIDDDHLDVTWPIPNGVPTGNYEIVWDLFSFWQYTIPGGFNIDCIAPPAVITDNGVLYGCVGDSVLLQANTGPGYSWQWYNFGALIPGATSSDYYAKAYGSYSVKVSDALGCGRFSAALTKSFVNPPAALVTPATPAPICAGSSVNLITTFNSTFTYQWYFNGNLINGATTNTIAASDSGSYTVRVTNSSGCSKLSNPVIVSYGGGPPALITPSGPTTFCAGGSVNLVANAGTGFTYQWFRYGNLMPNTSQTITVHNAGVYKVQVTDAAGCSTKSAAVTVSVIAAPPAIISVIGSTSICPGDSTLLLANSGTGYTYQWYKYGQPIAGATSQSIYVKNAGQYKVRVIHPLGCSRKSPGVFITVLPAPSATITPQGSTAICAGDNVILQANTGAGYTYEWKKFANIIPGETASSYSATTAGKYRVIVTGTNGCFRVSNPVDVTIVCREMLEQTVSEILIYPNPANEFISVNAADITLIKIMDSKGRVVLTLEENPHQIDISSLPPGLYLTVIYREKDVFTGRFIKN